MTSRQTSRHESLLSNTKIPFFINKKRRVWLVSTTILLPCIQKKLMPLHSPDPNCFLFFFPVCSFFTLVWQQLTPNDLLVAAASPYGLSGYHHSLAVPGTRASEPLSSNGNRAGLLSTVTDAVAGPAAATTTTSSSVLAVHQPVNRRGNLDWLIHSLNTNLPDPAALIREPNLTPNLKHMISGGASSSSNSTLQRSPQHVAFADEKSPALNQHRTNCSSPARNLVPVSANANGNTNNKFPSVSRHLVVWSCVVEPVC